jgi:hypothetical protein
LQNLVRRARRRLLGNELLAQGSNSASAALGAFILLLLLGTEILNWQIVAAVPVAAFAVGMYFVHRRLPSPYGTAQIVDRRLDLADTISTAVYFSEVNPQAPVTPEIREAQIEHAGRVAETVDARRAIPFVLPRGAYVAAALLLVASSLFALRYGISKQLDLRRPLANFLPDTLTSSPKTRQAANNKRNPKQTPEAPDENGTSADEQQEKGQGAEDPSQAQSPADQDAMANAKQDGKSASGKKQDGSDDQMATDDADGNDSGSEKNGDEGQQGGQQGDNKKQGNQQQGQQSDQNAQNDSSVMNKLKDAFNNLMSRMKPQQQPQGNQQGSQDQQQNQGKSQQGSKQQNSKEGTPQQGQQGDAQEGEDGQEAKNAENSQQSKGQGKSDSKQSSKQPGSGIGSQDGDKAIKNAEQLAAMGKISEILGKRSANLTGEATVEVQSTSQQLRTPYANKGAQHTQGGAEIRRDEVPVALQPMVQQYFETIRKQAPAPAKK